jgi:hypothetical protein
MSTRVQVRRGTLAQWASANPILGDGEIGYITDLRSIKVGDGATVWNSLPPLYTGGGHVRGAFVANAFFRANDVIFSGGQTYYALADFTTGSSFNANDGNWGTFPIIVSGYISQAEKGANSGVATLGSDGTLAVAQRPSGMVPTQLLQWTGPDGDVAVGNGRWTAPMPTGGTIQSFQSAVEVGPDGQAIIVDLEMMGTGTLFNVSSGLHRPTIPIGSGGPQASSLVVPDITSFSAGARFRHVVKQVGVLPSSITPYIAGRSTESSTTGTSKVINVPTSAGPQIGDILLAKIVSTSTAPDTVPSGWSVGPAAGASGGPFWVRYYTKVYAGEAGPYTWVFTSAGSQTFANASLTWIRGGYQTSPIDNSTALYYAATTGAMTPPALTTSFDGSLDLYLWSTLNSVSATGGAAPSGYTGYVGFTSASNAHIGYRTQATAGALATPSVTPSASTAAVITRIAIRANPVTSSFTPGQKITSIARYTEV